MVEPVGDREDEVLVLVGNAVEGVERFGPEVDTIDVLGVSRVPNAVLRGVTVDHQRRVRPTQHRPTGHRGAGSIHRVRVADRDVIATDQHPAAAGRVVAEDRHRGTQIETMQLAAGQRQRRAGDRGDGAQAGHPGNRDLHTHQEAVRHEGTTIVPGEGAGGRRVDQGRVIGGPGQFHRRGGRDLQRGCHVDRAGAGGHGITGQQDDRTVTAPRVAGLARGRSRADCVSEAEDSAGAGLAVQLHLLTDDEAVRVPGQAVRAGQAALPTGHGAGDNQRSVATTVDHGQTAVFAGQGDGPQTLGQSRAGKGQGQGVDGHHSPLPGLAIEDDPLAGHEAVGHPTA